jgi:hypothetical protein
MDQFRDSDEFKDKIKTLTMGDELHGEATAEAMGGSLISKLHIMEGSILNVEDGHKIPSILFQIESLDGTASTHLLGVPHIRDIIEVCGKWLKENEHLDDPDHHSPECDCDEGHTADDIFPASEYTLVSDEGEAAVDVVSQQEIQNMATVDIKSGGLKVIPIPDDIENMDDAHEFEVYAIQIETMASKKMQFIMQPQTAHELSLHIAKWGVARMFEEADGRLPNGLKSLIDDILRGDNNNDDE